MFEVVWSYPGTWLDSTKVPSIDARTKIQDAFESLDSVLLELLVAFDLYEGARAGILRRARARILPNEPGGTGTHLDGRFLNTQQSIGASAFSGALWRLILIADKINERFLDGAESTKIEGFRENNSGLKSVRDTLQHLEERSFGENRKGPIPDLILLMIGGSGDDGSYSVTAGDGQIATVAISPRTIVAARDLVQHLIQAFPWTGPTELRPRPGW